jgi:hypothetical protein
MLLKFFRAVQMPVGVSPSSAKLAGVRDDHHLCALEINGEVSRQDHVLKSSISGSKGQCVSYSVCLAHSKGWKGLDALATKRISSGTHNVLSRTFR